MAQSSVSSASKTQIRSSLSRWQGDLGEDLRPLFASFVEEALNRVRGPFLVQQPPRQALAYFEEAFRFALDRTEGDIRAVITRRATRGVAVLVNMADQPFIMDTILLFLRARNAETWGGFNIVFRVERDASGRITAIGTEAGKLESLILIDADPGDLGDLAGAGTDLSTNLAHAVAMVADFKRMIRAIEQFAEKAEALADRQPDKSKGLHETAAFLKWLLGENFVFMGVEADGGPFGIQRLRGPYHHDPSARWPEPHFPGTVLVRKSPTESPVHRAGRIDEILVKLPDDGQLFIRGMFTYRAVTQPSRNVPILRGVLSDILNDQTTTGPGSFRYKGIANVFDSLPTEFLFTAPRAAIGEMAERVFEAEQQHDVGVTFTMNGPDSAFCLVAMPKGQFRDELRRQLETEIVATTRATYCDHGVFVGRYDTALLHYFLTGVTDPGADAIAALTERIRQFATPW